jgi:hypothetical protein
VGSASEHLEGATLTVEESEAVLGILCVEYGFCLPPEAYDRLADFPPTTPGEYVEAVVVAEGLDPSAVDAEMIKAMQAVVRDAMVRSSSAAGSLPPNTSLERTRER